MIAFTLLSLGLALIFVLGLDRSPADRPPVRSWAVLATGAVAPLLVLLTFYSAHRAPGSEANLWGDVRIVLSAVRFSPTALAGGVGVGGLAAAAAGDQTAASNPNLVIEAAPSGLLTFQQSNGVVSAIAGDSLEDPRVGLVRVGRGVGARFAGAVRFKVGDELCLEACDAPGADRYRLAWGATRLVRVGSDQSLPDLPYRKVLGIPSLNAAAPSTRIYPLRDFAAPQRGAPGADPCLGRWRCLRSGAPVRSILFQRGGFFGGDLYVVLLDPGASLSRSGRVIARTLDAVPVATLGPQPTAMAVFSVEYAGADQTLDDPSLQSSRLVERRSFTASADDKDGLTIVFDTPSTQTLRRRDMDKAVAQSANRESGGEAAALKLSIEAGETANGGPPNETRLGFGLLGAGFADSLSAKVTLPSPSWADEGLRTVGFTKSTSLIPQLPFGVATWVGEDWGAQFRIDRLDEASASLALWPWLIGLSCLLMVWMEFQRRREDPARWIIASAVEYLLALRLLVAVGGAYVDTGNRAVDAVGDALAAFICAPLLLSLVPGGPRRPGWAQAGHALFVLLAIAAIRAAGPSSTETSLLGLATLLALLRALLILWGKPADRYVADSVTLVAEGAMVSARWVWTKASRWAGRLIPARKSDAPLPPPSALSQLPDSLRRVWDRTGPLGRAATRQVGLLKSGLDAFPRWAVRLLFWMVVARLVLAVGGFKESVPLFGFRAAVSLVYVPVMLAGFAGLFWASRRQAVQANPYAALAFWLLLAGAVIAPMLVNDNGFIIFALPLALWGLLIHLRQLNPDRRWWTDTLGVALWQALLAVVLCKTLPEAVERIEHGRLLLALVVALAGAFACLRFSRTAMWAAPALGAVMILAVIHTSPGPSQAKVDAVIGSHDQQAELRLLKAYADQNQNALRVWNTTQPSRVRAVGTRESEDFVASMAHLADYTRTPQPDEGKGLFGRGFLNLPPPTVLRLYHFSDNVSAIHLIAPFGRAGAVGFLAILWAAAALLTRRVLATGADDDRDWRPIAGLLALWAVALVDTYMILANLQFAPFTGKNVYFLVATSISDLAEGLVLMAMATLLLRRQA